MCALARLRSTTSKEAPPYGYNHYSPARADSYG